MATYAKTNLLSYSSTGSLPLDHLQIPHDGDEEIYRIRQFNTTSKGFVNRGYIKKTIFLFFFSNVSI
jgi:hypothetical protein